MQKSGRVGRPLSADSADTRQRILASARSHFAHFGYRSTTNRQIADDVGITSGAIYHYVASKAELYAAVYCDTIDRVYTQFEIVAAECDTVSEQFVAILQKAIEMQRAEPSIIGFIGEVGAEMRRHPDLVVLLAPQRGRHTILLTSLVTAAADRGEIHPDIDPLAIVDLFTAILMGLAQFNAVTGDHDRYDSAVEVFERLISGTLITD